MKFKRKITNISSGAYNQLLNYDYPGNIRELENILEHSFVLCGSNEIQPEHLPDKFNSHITTDQGEKNFNPLFHAEKKIITETLQKCNGNRTIAAKELGIDKSTLWRKMKKYGIRSEGERFYFEEFGYDNLENAIEYADTVKFRKQLKRANELAVDKLCVHCGNHVGTFIGGSVTMHGPLHNKCSTAFYNSKRDSVED